MKRTEDKHRVTRIYDIPQALPDHIPPQNSRSNLSWSVGYNRNKNEKLTLIRVHMKKKKKKKGTFLED